MNETMPVADRLRYLLQSLQIQPALQALNALTEYRFTAIYRFTPSGAANLAIFDRMAAPPEAMLVVPEGASYCGIVRDTRDAFLVTRSREDGRVLNHPARDAVQSYCGVPLVGERGDVFGTLCHFDFEPHDAPANLADLMLEVSRYLDPEAGLGELAETISQRIDRLAEMTDAIALASPGEDELRETFDMYAQPVLLQAEALHPAVRQAMERRISDLLASLLQPHVMAQAARVDANAVA